MKPIKDNNKPEISRKEALKKNWELWEIYSSNRIRNLYDFKS